MKQHDIEVSSLANDSQDLQLAKSKDGAKDEQRVIQFYFLILLLHKSFSTQYLIII